MGTLPFRRTQRSRCSGRHSHPLLAGAPPRPQRLARVDPHLLGPAYGSGPAECDRRESYRTDSIEVFGSLANLEDLLLQRDRTRTFDPLASMRDLLGQGKLLGQELLQDILRQRARND